MQGDMDGQFPSLDFEKISRWNGKVVDFRDVTSSHHPKEENRLLVSLRNRIEKNSIILLVIRIKIR